MSVSAKLCVSVVVFYGSEVLLVEEKDGKLNLPSGHIEHGESPIKAACRELWEETGLIDPIDDLKFIDIIPVGETMLERESGNYYTKVYAGMVKRVVQNGTSDEDVVACHWVTTNELQKIPASKFRNALVTAKVQMAANVIVHDEENADYFVRCDINNNISWG